MTTGTVHAHRNLGLSDEQVLEMYRAMVLARRLDDRMWALNRQGRAPFVVSASGHEATQIGVASALDREIDWVLPYYRDVGVALAWGVSVEEILLAVFSKATDPSSGGRQMPNHWSDSARRVFSHSSPIATQYPHATGIAIALRLQGRPGLVAVFGGEGSTSEGDWHEAMNLAGIHQLPVIFVVENNHYAISVPEVEEVAGSIRERAYGYGIPGVEVDGNRLLDVYAAAREAVDRARAGEGASLIVAHTYRYYGHTSDDDDKVYRTAEEVEQWRRRDPIGQFRQYLVETRLLDPAAESDIDERAASEVAEAVQKAAAAPDPEDPFAHVYARVIEPGPATTEPEPPVAGEEVNLVTAVNRTLHEIMDAHPAAVVLGEDVADPKGGVFKATAGLTDRFGKGRCFNSPLAEAGIVGAAVGMAAAGTWPIAEIQFADFIHPAFDQVVSEAARVHYRTNGDWGCPLTLRVPYGGGVHGGLYHSQSIEAFYAHVPGLKVVVPSTPADVKGLMWEAVEDPDPVMVLEPKRLYRLARGPFPHGEYRVPIGRAAIRRQGNDVTVAAYGAMAREALEAADRLAGDGIDVEVIDLRSLRPLDWPTIEASVRKTSRFLIVHEDNEFGGFGAEVAAQVADKAFEWLDAPVRRYAAPEVPAFPFNEHLEQMVMPSADGIVERVTALARY